jgi:hypothetical protein
MRIILLIAAGLFAGCANFQPIVDQATAQTVAIEHAKYGKELNSSCAGQSA